MKLHLESLYDHFTRYQKPHKIKWTKEETPLSVYVDPFIWSNTTDNAIALILEPRSIQDRVCDSMFMEYRKFKYVFTHDSVLLDRLPNAKPLYFGGVWSTTDYVKTRDISMPCSIKDMCAMHRIRRQIADYCKRSGKADTYGKFDGGKYAKNSTIYGHYMFSIAIENYIDDIYFTEKICNCLAAKAVPIYWGAKDIGNIFDPEGIIQVHSTREILEIVDNWTHDDYVREYEKRRPAIERNFETVKKYACFEDSFYDMYHELLEALNQ